MKKKLLFLIISSMIVFSGCALTESVSVSDEGVLEASVEASVTEIEDVTEDLPIKEEVVLPKAYYTESELPDGGYQKTLTFPDRLGFHNNGSGDRTG